MKIGIDTDMLRLLSHFSCVRLCVTLWTVARWTPLSMEFSRQEYWSGLPRPPPRDLPNPGIKPGPPALAGRFFIPEPPGQPRLLLVIYFIYSNMYYIIQLCFHYKEREKSSSIFNQHIHYNTYI